MKHLKKYKIFEDNSRDNLDKLYEDVMVLRDIILELKDMGYIVNVYTPVIYDTIFEKHLDLISITIEIPDNWIQFYDKDYPLINKNREEVDSIILRALVYLEENGYVIYKYDKKPTEFSFINNPTSYIITFELI